MAHDHPIEWVWLSFTLVDVWASASSWLAASHDWHRAKLERDRLDRENRIKAAAKFAVTSAVNLLAIGNLLIAILLLVSAIVSLFLPPPPPSYLTVRQSLIVISLLILVTIGNTFLSTFGRLVRYRLVTGYFERLEAVRLSRRVERRATERTVPVVLPPVAGQAIADAYTEPLIQADPAKPLAPQAGHTAGATNGRLDEGREG